MKLFKQYRESFVLFIVFSIFFSMRVLFSCRIFPTLSFDNQALFTWNYLSTKGYLPYRDIYYPYGILYFFKDSSLSFKIIYIFLLSLIFSGLFFLLRKLWKDRVLSYLSISIFFLFCIFFIDTDTLSRYGTLLFSIVLYAYYFSKETFLSKKTTICMGILNGLIFSLIYDQGIYSILFFILFLFFNPILQKQQFLLKQYAFYIQFLQSLIFFFLGFAFGAFPFIMYLLLTSSFHLFIVHLQTLKDVFFYAKTPFFHAVISPENICIFLSLISSLFFLVYKVVFNKNTKSLSFYYITSVTVLLIFLEQKNIIRSIANQLTFIALFLLLVLSCEFYQFLKTKGIGKYQFSLFLFLVTIVIFHNSGMKPHAFILSSRANACIKKNQQQLLFAHKNFRDVQNYLEKKLMKNTTFLSYPGNPILYTLLTRTPPYYFSTYEASPVYAQQVRINFLQNPQTTYVVFDLSLLSIQDDVPEYVRSSRELEYILDNFHIIQQVDNFIILEKNQRNQDFFKQELLQRLPTLKKFLLDIHLNSIPKSEGVFKNNFIPNLSTLIQSNNPENINMYFSKHQISSNKLILIFSSKDNHPASPMTSLIFYTNDALTGTVSFTSCTAAEVCILDLSRIPLFFTPRIIKKMTVIHPENIGMIKVAINSSNLFW